MKNILIALLLCPVFAIAQDYKQNGDYSYLNDTIMVQGQKFKIGDTLHLGFGSGANNQFLYLWQEPTLRNVGVGGQPSYLEHIWSNTFITFAGFNSYKLSGQSFIVPVFNLSGNKKIKVNAQLSNAIKTKEIIFP